jgi:hypothetical protein
VSEQFGSHLLEFVIPSFAKTANERLAEETVDREMEATPQGDGIATDIPAVIVEPREAGAEALLADRVEGARDRFAPRGASFTIGLLCGAIATAAGAVVTCEYAVASPHDAGDEVAIGIRIGHPIAVDDLLGGST